MTETVDTIITKDGCTVQHGPLNDRVYLMHFDKEAMNEELPLKLLALAEEQGRGKVVAKIPNRMKKAFMDAGYGVEARVREMFGKDDGIFATFYLQEREHTVLDDKEMSILHECVKMEPVLDNDVTGVQELTESNAAEISALMAETFETYPYPITEEDYVLKKFQSGVRYFGIRDNNILVSVGGVEIDRPHKCVEMTDMVTMEDFRRQGLSGKILTAMQIAMKKDGQRTAYAIARSRSPGINDVFATHGYFYGGSLRSNTNFNGQLENMNIWHKRL